MKTINSVFFRVSAKLLAILTLLFLTLSSVTNLSNAQTQEPVPLLSSGKGGPTHVYHTTHTFDKSKLPKVTKHGKGIIDPIPNKDNKSAVNASYSVQNPGNDGNNGVSYKGGNVMHTLNIHLIFWEPQYLSGTTNPANFSSTYFSNIESFFTDLTDSSNTGYLQLLSQYNDSSQYIPSSLTYDITTDTNNLYPQTCTSGDGTSYPSGYSPSLSSCMTDDDTSDEVEAMSSTFSLGTGLNNLYIVYTAEDQGTNYDGGWALSDDPQHGYCGYHNADLVGTTEYLYAQIPYPTASSLGTEPAGGCEGSMPTSPVIGGSNYYADYAAINTTSHELAEAATDPEGALGSGYAGWVDTNTTPASEMGDLCEGTFPTAKYDLSSGNYTANISINGDPYELQSEWSNDSYIDPVTHQQITLGCTLAGQAGSNSSRMGTVFQTKMVTTGSYPSYSFTGSLVATNASTGANLWSSDSVTGGFKITETNTSHTLQISAPVFDPVNDLLYVLESFNGSTDLYSITPSTGVTEHDFGQTGLNYGTTPVFDSSGNIYVAGTNNHIYCFAKDNSTALWNYTTTNSSGNLNFAIDPGKNVLYYPSSDGKLYGIYDELASSPGTSYDSYTPGSTYGNIKLNYQPVVDSSGNIYIGTRQTSSPWNAYVVSVNSSGTYRWNRQITNGDVNQPVLGISGLFVTGPYASGQPSLWALSTVDGSKLWTTDPIGIGGSIATGGSAVYFQAQLCCDLASYGQSSGSQNWDKTASSPNFYSSPVVLSATNGGTTTEYLYENGELSSTAKTYILNATDGSTVASWSNTNLGAPVASYYTW